MASELGLERYVEAFEANDIDTAVLRALSADDLEPDAAVGAGGSDHRRGLLDRLSQQHSTSLVIGWIDGVASSHPKVQRQQSGSGRKFPGRAGPRAG